MRRIPLFICLGLGLARPDIGLADQLQCNSKEVAEAALASLPPGAIIMDFCSLCEAKAQVVRIHTAKVIEDCKFELVVTGEVLAETSAAFTDGYVAERARFVDPSRTEYEGRLDLAYVYVPTDGQTFRWLGGLLGLEATINTATIELPAALAKKLGVKAAPASKARGKAEPAAPPRPDTRAVRSVFDYFRRGESGPVLAHLSPCLEIDLAKSSPRRYECLTEVSGPVAPGTKVFAWTDWLVPRQMDGVAHFHVIKDGEVRMRKEVRLRGRPRSPIVAATAGAQLSQEGTYTLRVLLDAQTVAEVQVEVRK